MPGAFQRRPAGVRTIAVLFCARGTGVAARTPREGRERWPRSPRSLWHLAPFSSTQARVAQGRRGAWPQLRRYRRKARPGEASAQLVSSRVHLPGGFLSLLEQTCVDSSGDSWVLGLSASCISIKFPPSCINVKSKFPSPVGPMGIPELICDQVRLTLPKPPAPGAPGLRGLSEQRLGLGSDSPKDGGSGVRVKKGHFGLKERKAENNTHYFSLMR